MCGGKYERVAQDKVQPSWRQEEFSPGEFGQVEINKLERNSSLWGPLICLKSGEFGHMLEHPSISSHFSLKVTVWEVRTISRKEFPKGIDPQRPNAR